jgi:hypothetical protein
MFEPVLVEEGDPILGADADIGERLSDLRRAGQEVGPTERVASVLDEGRFVGQHRTVNSDDLRYRRDAAHTA